jgi:hypothetical protein
MARPGERHHSPSPRPTERGEPPGSPRSNNVNPGVHSATPCGAVRPNAAQERHGPDAAHGGHGSDERHGSDGAQGRRGPQDPELVTILPAITGPGGQFRHRQHINLAFYAVRRYGMPDAVGMICGWIRQIAAYERAPQKYHHTVSRAWVELVAHHVAADPDCADFDVFADRNPGLLDKRLLGRHYRSSTLAAGPARCSWVEPDLLPFP